MRVTIFGATGQTGRLLVEQALARGDRVTAVVRDPRRLEVRHPELSVDVVHELADLAATNRALRNADAVLSAIGPRGRRDAPVAAAGVPVSWLRFPIGTLKLLGALGLVAGLWVPGIGVAAAAGLVVFFVCAMYTHVRAGDL